MPGRHTKRAYSEWSRVRALVSQCHEKGYAPDLDVWAEIVGMAEELGAGVEEPSEVEEAFRYGFEQDGFTPEEARAMAQNAAEPRGRRVWG